MKNQFGQLIAQNTGRINDEFMQNQQRADNVPAPLSLNELTPSGDMQTVQVKEEFLDPHSTQVRVVEVINRYNHEKSKIRFLFFTAKKLSDSSKKDLCPAANPVLYNL